MFPKKSILTYLFLFIILCSVYIFALPPTPPVVPIDPDFVLDDNGDVIDSVVITPDTTSSSSKSSKSSGTSGGYYYPSTGVSNNSTLTNVSSDSVSQTSSDSVSQTSSDSVSQISSDPEYDAGMIIEDSINNNLIEESPSNAGLFVQFVSSRVGAISIGTIIILLIVVMVFLLRRKRMNALPKSNMLMQPDLSQKQSVVQQQSTKIVQSQLTPSQLQFQQQQIQQQLLQQQQRYAYQQQVQRMQQQSQQSNSQNMSKNPPNNI